ncbi:MAG: type II toxin-antitoxin system YafQ family toxin [Lachnospiraceae bacterium]|nr:type II toxin-antitoxin system YafQ family toxin [Lachnospiraceae bacterium]
MLNPIYSTQFKKDYKRCQKRNYAMPDLLAVMSDLEAEKPLEPKNKEHQLQGDYAGCLECHIKPDWLLIYQVDKEFDELYFVRTGTHSDLF